MKNRSAIVILMITMLLSTSSSTRAEKTNQPEVNHTFSLLWQRTFNVTELSPDGEIGIFKTKKGPHSGVEKIFDVRGVLNGGLLWITTIYWHNKAIAIDDSGEIIDIDDDNPDLKEFKAGKVFVFNESGLVWEKGFKKWIRIMGFSQDGEHILVSVGGKGQLYRRDGTFLWEKQDKGSYRFSQNETRILVYSNAKPEARIKVFDLKGNLIWRTNFAKDIQIRSASIFNEGRSMIVSLRKGSEEKISLYDFREDPLWEKTLKRKAHSILVSEEGGIFFLPSGYSANGKGGIFDINGRLLLSDKEIEDKFLLSGINIVDERAPLSNSVKGFYKDQLFIKRGRNEYLIDSKGNIKPFSDRKSDIIVSFISLLRKEKAFKKGRVFRETLSISPDLHYLLFRVDKYTLRYYKIGEEHAK